MRILFILCMAGLSLGFIANPAQAQTSRKEAICQVFGSVFVEKERNFADFTVYIEENDAFADLVVYREDNQLYADETGVWFFTNNPDFARFRIFIVKERNLADITIAYTNTRSFAGCK